MALFGRKENNLDVNIQQYFDIYSELIDKFLSKK